MSKLRMVAVFVGLGLSAGSSCSRAMRVARDAASAETGAPVGPGDAGMVALPDGGIADASGRTAEVLAPGGGVDTAADSPMGLDTTTTAAPEVARDAGVVVWTGPDATVTIGGRPLETDGGIVPSVHAFPGKALVSHTKLFASVPDIVYRFDEVGDVSYLDLDGNSLGDIVVSQRTAISLYRQGPAGIFRTVRGVTLAGEAFLGRFTFGDLNGDGLADLVMAYYPAGDARHAALAVYRQTVAGFADPPDQVVPVAADTSGCARIYSLATDDMNGDGRLDIVTLAFIQQDGSASICEYGANVVQVFLQDPQGTFVSATQVSPATPSATSQATAVAAAIGDIDRDGRKDLAILLDGRVRSGYPPTGYETLVYSQGSGGFSAVPVQMLSLSQFLRNVRLSDVDGDGRLDVLVRPGQYEFPVDLSATTPGLSGVFLQKDDGTFDEARTVTPGGWVPAATDVKTQPVGIDIRDVDGDAARDLLLERNGVVEAFFRQEGGLFSTTPDVEIAALFPELAAAAQQPITVEFLPTDGGLVSSTGRFVRLAYGLADMDGDDRQDIVVAHSPFAPNVAPDPATGRYPYPGFQPNTYTEIRIHHQRPFARTFRAEVHQAEVVVDERILRIQATISNLTDVAADNVKVRVLADSSPGLLSYAPDMLAANFDSYAAWGRDYMLKHEDRIKGNPLGSDILIPRIEAHATIPLVIEAPSALVDHLELTCLFVVVDPDTNDNLLYKRSYPFVAPR